MRNYLYPIDDIETMTDTALLALIQEKTPTAQLQVDGVEVTCTVAIDIAQDQVEQARDLLQQRGHVFTEQQKREMSFLRWPEHA